MTVYQHTPEGIIQHHLTAQEVEDLATNGDTDARIEIARDQVAAHRDPHKKIAFLSWVFGIIDTKPEP